MQRRIERNLETGDAAAMPNDDAAGDATTDRRADAAAATVGAATGAATGAVMGGPPGAVVGAALGTARGLLAKKAVDSVRERWDEAESDGDRPGASAATEGRVRPEERSA